MSLTYLEAPVGDNPDYLVTLTDEAGAVYDPTDATAIWWTVKETLADADADAVFQKTLGSGITITSAAAGQILLQWSAADAAGLEANRSYYWSVRVRQSTGRITTPLQGLLTATPQHATLSYA